MRKNPERWTVRPTEGGRSTRSPLDSNTDALARAFEQSVDEGLGPRAQQLLSQTLGFGRVSGPNVAGMSGAQAVEAVGALNSGSLGGMSPSYKVNYHHPRPTWAGGGTTPPPPVSKVCESNIGKMAEKCKNMDPPRELIIEMDCPEAVKADDDA